MPQFKITSTSVVDGETVDAAMDAWRANPLVHVSEVTMVEVAALETPEQPKTIAQKVVATTRAMVKEAAAQVGVVEKPQMCPDHQVAMVKRPSKFRQGQFYLTCPEKLADGSRCKAKPL